MSTSFLHCISEEFLAFKYFNLVLHLEILLSRLAAFVIGGLLTRNSKNDLYYLVHKCVDMLLQYILMRINEPKSKEIR